MGQTKISDLQSIDDVSPDDMLLITDCKTTKHVTVAQLVGIVQRFSCPTCGGPVRDRKGKCIYCGTIYDKGR